MKVNSGWKRRWKQQRYTYVHTYKMSRVKRTIVRTVKRVPKPITTNQPHPSPRTVGTTGHPVRVVFDMVVDEVSK